MANCGGQAKHSVCMPMYWEVLQTYCGAASDGGVKQAYKCSGQGAASQEAGGANHHLATTLAAELAESHLLCSCLLRCLIRISSPQTRGLLECCPLRRSNKVAGLATEDLLEGQLGLLALRGLLLTSCRQPISQPGL